MHKSAHHNAGKKIIAEGLTGELLLPSAMHAESEPKATRGGFLRFTLHP